VTGPGDYFLYVTADEMAELNRRLDELFEAYRPRAADPSLRPAGARGVDLVLFTMTLDQP